MLGVQLVTRPSALVVAEKVVVVEEAEGEEGCKVSVTGMLGAGRPRVVSRTWHVIGGLGGVSVAIVAVVVVLVGCGGAAEKCPVKAEMRVVALSGIRFVWAVCVPGMYV